MKTNKTLKFQILVSLVFGALIVLFDTKQSMLSFLSGAGLIFFNLFIFFWVWNRIISKKLIALAVGVIVIKYAIFGVIIYLILKNPNVHPIWFSFGIGTLLITSILVALDSSEPEENQKESQKTET